MKSKKGRAGASLHVDGLCPYCGGACDADHADRLRHVETPDQARVAAIVARASSARKADVLWLADTLQRAWNALIREQGRAGASPLDEK